MAGKAWGWLVGVALSALLAAGPAAAQSAPQHKWKMMSLWQAGSLSQKIFEDFTKRVKEMSNGRLEIEPLPAGAIVAATESLDAVSSGVLEAQHGGTTYWTGKDAAFALLGDLQGGYETPYQMQQWLEYGGGKELVREVYKKYNVYFVDGVWWGVESLPAKKPIRTIEEFKGVKLRAPAGIGQDIFKLIGAAPVNMPGSEVYTALERGVIDATDWGTLSLNEDLGYHKIAKYPLYPGFHSMPMADVAVNMQKWNALSPDLKAIVEVATRDFSRDMVQRLALEDEKVAKAAKEHGVELVNWSAEDRKKFRAVAVKVWAEYAKRSDNARKIYESQVAFLKQLGLLD
jgi:TRAP-type mannitol/chloroaromatic compound transport system substrate-binding protein